MTSTQYREIRKKLGLTQAQLAVRLGVSVITIKRRENGGTITREAELAIMKLLDRNPKP